MKILNNIEIKVLEAVKENIEDCTGSEFGYTTEIELDGFTSHQIAGYLSSLSKKKMIHIDELGFDQVFLTVDGCNTLGLKPENFETY